MTMKSMAEKWKLATNATVKDDTAPWVDNSGFVEPSCQNNWPTCQANMPDVMKDISRAGARHCHLCMLV